MAGGSGQPKVDVVGVCHDRAQHQRPNQPQQFNGWRLLPKRFAGKISFVVRFLGCFAAINRVDLEAIHDFSLIPREKSAKRIRWGFCRQGPDAAIGDGHDKQALMDPH